MIELERHLAEEADYAETLGAAYEALSDAVPLFEKLERIAAESQSPNLPQHHVKVRFPDLTGTKYKRKAADAQQVIMTLQPSVLHKEVLDVVKGDDEE